jgi:peptidoglycan/LPS O-acetylase OafA/YrhL
LDGLRFLSFFLVFLAHGFRADNPEITSANWYKALNLRFFSAGETGVSFFFVLSGFLITYLLLKEKELNGKIDVKSFYIRRSLRIWPLYYFCVIFGFFIFPIFKMHYAGTFHETANPILCSTFLNNFDRIQNGNPHALILGVLWSVGVEEQFYLIWPLLFLFTPKKFYGIVFLGVLIISTVFRTFFLHRTVIDWHTLGVITDMAIGGLGAYLILNNIKFKNGIENFPKAFISIIYLLAFVFIIFNYQVFSTTFLFIAKRLIMASVFILIILEQNFSHHSLFKIGNWKMISKLGKYTYGLYCLHAIGILISLTVLRKFSLFTSTWQTFCLEMPFALALSIFISWISFRYYESWFLKLKTRFSYITKE